MGFLFVSFILSMFIANIAVVVMLLPIIEAIKEEMDKFSDDAEENSDHKSTGQEVLSKAPEKHRTSLKY